MTAGNAAFPLHGYDHCLGMSDGEHASEKQKGWATPITVDVTSAL